MMNDILCDLSYGGGTIVDDTLQRYPAMAEAGWCFSGNISKKDIPSDPFTWKEYVNEKIKNYSHMEADSVLIGYGDYKAYWQSGKMDPKMLPTFVRMESKKYLKVLGFKKRNPWINVNSRSANYEISRFDLMILGDE